MKQAIWLVLIGIASTACDKQGDPSSVNRLEFGRLPAGDVITLYTLSNASGTKVSIMDLGATITSIKVPDRNGKLGDITLGFDNPSQYLTDSPYFGAIVGRYANRIAQAQFELDGETYRLAANDGANHLHGGDTGFDKLRWQSEVIDDSEHAAVRFSLVSPDGQEGYPGELSVEVLYELTADSDLRVGYKAETTKPTPVNLSQHTYFNLNGHDSGSILGHHLTINAEQFTPVDSTLIPTGELREVADTPMDFRAGKLVGDEIGTETEQLGFGRGYDHNWVLSGDSGDVDVAFAARLYSPSSGRYMDVFTDQPGLQFYSGNFLDGTIVGKANTTYEHRQGLCLETQHFPDSPNQDNFPSTILRPGEVFESTTVFKFGVAR